MRISCLLFFLVFTFSPSILSAEIYRGITPFTNLADLRKMFSNAEFKKINPAWAKEEDQLYEISGTGLSGKIIIKLTDKSAEYKKYFRENPNENKAFGMDILYEPRDEIIEVNWVRWIPSEKIPLQRLISKYGTPDDSGFDENDFRPYKSWSPRGIDAYLSDDGIYVLGIDYSFTTEDFCKARKARGMPLTSDCY